MPRKSKAALARSAAAKKGWRTRRINEQIEAIEELLGEEFETLAEAEAALKEETEPEEDDYVDVIGIDSLYE